MNDAVSPDLPEVLRAPHRPGRRIGVLMVNLGTPESPTPGAIRRYLRQFLSDRRVVEVPRPIWWLILNLLILPLRPLKLAKTYGSVWHKEGSPLMVISRQQHAALQVAIGYGETFTHAGGTQLRYIPALNAQADHITMLADLVRRHLQGWEDSRVESAAEIDTRMAEVARVLPGAKFSGL